MNNSYVIIWTDSAGALFTLTDTQGKIVVFDRREAAESVREVISSPSALSIDKKLAEGGRYAIPAQDLDRLFGVSL